MLTASARRFHSWTADHQRGLMITFWVCCVLGVGADVVIVFGFGADSISERTWVAEAAHPTLIAAGTLAFVGVAYLVRKYRGCVFFAAYLCGHLFCHY